MASRSLVVVAAISVLIGALFAGAAFNSLFFRRFLTGIAEGRLLATALDTRDAFARSAALGLPLAQFEGGSRLAEQARRADPAIVVVRVYQSGPSGFLSVPLGETEPGDIPLPPAWSRPMRRSPEAPWWPVEDSQGTGVLVPIPSAFGTTTGLLAMLQDRAVTAEPQRRFESHLLELAILIGLPAALGLWVLMRLLTGPALGNLPGWLAHLEDLRTRPPEPRPGDIVGELIAPALKGLADGERS